MALGVFESVETDELLDRLTELDTRLTGDAPVELTVLLETLREVALIHIELARRTGTGWRPL